MVHDVSVFIYEGHIFSFELEKVRCGPRSWVVNQLIWEPKFLATIHLIFFPLPISSHDTFNDSWELGIHTDGWTNLEVKIVQGLWDKKGSRRSQRRE